jgi:hypothetical protein
MCFSLFEAGLDFTSIDLHKQIASFDFLAKPHRHLRDATAHFGLDRGSHTRADRAHDFFCDWPAGWSDDEGLKSASQRSRQGQSRQQELRERYFFHGNQKFALDNMSK